MITRLGSLLLLLYALGFVLFAFTLGKPQPETAPASDAAIVLTGGPGRIEHAIAVLKADKAQRLLVAGADPARDKEGFGEENSRIRALAELLRRPR